MSQMEADYYRDVRHIAIRSQRLRNRVEKDVLGVCQLLKKLDEKCRPRENEDLPESLKASLRKHFRDIYWSLKLHMLFHLGRVVSEPRDGESNADSELQKVGRLHMVDLTDEEMSKLPGQKHAIDPGSKLMEIFSAIAMNSEEQDSGHAENVMVIAKDHFKFLRSKNLFKPKALAKVSHNDKWSVGSSVAVSEFLRPLCLYRRIANFKQSLKKAIVSNQRLVTKDNQNWSSSAMAFAESNELKAIPPCQNCAMMFETFVGFIVPTLEQGGSGTYLGACAEYCPVDQLLPVEVLSENDNQLINDKLQSNREQCTVLYTDFRGIENRCNEAFNQRRLRNMTFTDLGREVRDKVHIFGVKPECNIYFGGRT